MSKLWQEMSKLRREMSKLRREMSKLWQEMSKLWRVEELGVLQEMALPRFGNKNAFGEQLDKHGPNTAATSRS